jgi:hypothetical protein
MMRILLVETASPKRIYHKVEEILKTNVNSNPEIALLCREKNRKAFSGLSGVEIYSVAFHKEHTALKRLNEKKFDMIFAFWTGEKEYRRMKLLALRLRAKRILITSGDGNEFLLTWKAICRHAIFRWQHPLPADHWDFVAPQYATKRVLIIQSAEPAYVLKALDLLKEGSLFRNACYTIFCRNQPEVVASFRGHPMLHRLLTHSEARDSWKHLKALRRQKFDAIVLFMTGDPSYRKIKLFAFLLGVPLRHLLIFNETIDCFFFSWNQWWALLSHRIRARSHLGVGSSRNPAIQVISVTTKSVLLPFRFLWLLLVWVRLRLFGLKLLRKRHDYSLQLPLFPGP